MTVIIVIAAFALIVEVLFCVGSYRIKRNSAASALNPTDAGGSQAGLDFLPEVISSLALVPPLAGPTPPSGHPSPDVVRATGRGLNKDYYCADDVAITITDTELWLEVGKGNLLRVKRIKRMQVNDWRKVSA